MLQLTDGVFRIWTYAVSQNHEAQQVHVDHMSFNLLLSHVQQVQLVSMLNYAHRHCHHPEAVAAEVIPHLCKIVGLQIHWVCGGGGGGGGGGGPGTGG